MGPSGEKGRLIIVDYADRWLFSNVTWLLKNALLHDAAIPVRVLMVGRTANAWPSVCAVLDTYEADTSVQPLAALSSETGDRAEMFAAACASWARSLAR